MRAINILNTKHCSHAKLYKLIIHEIKAYEVTFLLVQKVFLCIEELKDIDIAKRLAMLDIAKSLLQLQYITVLFCSGT